jgi:hypothetical protein
LCCVDGPINLPANRLALNSRFSQMLSAPMLMILDCSPDLSSEELYRKAMIARNDATNNGAEVLGLILNKVIIAPFFLISFFSIT